MAVNSIAKVNRPRGQPIFTILSRFKCEPLLSRMLSSNDVPGATLVGRGVELYLDNTGIRCDMERDGETSDIDEVPFDVGAVLDRLSVRRLSSGRWNMLPNGEH
jgi:hypothetical protein